MTTLWHPYSSGLVDVVDVDLVNVAVSDTLIITCWTLTSSLLTVTIDVYIGLQLGYGLSSAWRRWD